ncbi:arf-GAP domain and FG repeat-containing protein 1 isoform X1 [Patella vulgata]|uniref:arf-GAP domain and FG repeat-containing protein 1 isoform X1 n=2 Tax=Patella vulgata TaxID=6465 RepID=UPI0021808EF3|nr:arf-GAP domain and FG repeat-containing protein 1 isoform X1 [Patella vulgata]
MASNKKKQDEKHLKMLRDMVSLTSNKQCFDCHQRGPTYINMTIGSFVCTSCSGILRGLNPPHRVKSISMASFSPDEIESLKSHGNEFCRKVYLALYDSRSWPEPDSRDEQRVRDFMVQKYENKRWYNAPTQEMKDEARSINEAAISKKNQTKPLRSLLGDKTPKLVLQDNISPQMNRQHPHSSTPVIGQIPLPTAASVSSSNPTVTPTSKPQQKSGFDLLGELGSDPFGCTAPATNASVPATGGFADFSNFNSQPMVVSSSQPVSNNTSSFAPVGTGSSANTPTGLGAFTSIPNAVPPPTTSNTANPSDKYAAFADLFADVSTESTTTAGWNSTNTVTTPSSGLGAADTFGGTQNWGNPASTGSANPFSGGGLANSQAPTAAPVINPFASGGQAMFGQPAQIPQSSAGDFFAFGSQPAQPAVAGNFGQFPSQNGGFPQTGGFNMAQPTSGFGLAQPNGLGQQQAFDGGWNQQPTVNPFMNTANAQQMAPRSNTSNPFL